MIRKRSKGDTRSEEEIREHYEIEVELANKLRKSSRDKRRSLNLYASLYNELYRRVSHHPELTKKFSPEKSKRAMSWQFGLLRPFINKHTNFLELGAGDCSLSLSMAKIVKNVFAIEVCNLIDKRLSLTSNFKLILTDGCNIPLPKDSIDVIYSSQLMEHIHPDDVVEQLQNIYNVLKPSGNYICVTPNKIGGPWDISAHYDQIARGFHLREYTIAELVYLFKDVGFKKLRIYAGARGRYMRFLISPLICLEKILFLLPYKLRSKISRSLVFRMFLGIKLVAMK